MPTEDEDSEREMEAPDSDESIYYARGDEVPPMRPLLTGDVLDGIQIPGLDDGTGLAIILTHPCSMRIDGVNLSPRIVVGRVRPHQHVSLSHWNGHARVMPLPILSSDTGHHAGYFDSIGVVSGATLAAAHRRVCLSERGINLLQQRFIFNLSRFVVPTARLHEASFSVFREVELQEEWLLAANDVGVSVREAEAAFHDWIRQEDTGGVRRQERIKQPQAIGAIQRDLRAELRARYAS